MKLSEILSNAAMQMPPRSNNMQSLGWHEGYIVVRFYGSKAIYVYGPEIPESEHAKILQNPFPDRIFTACIKAKFKCHKVEQK